MTYSSLRLRSMQNLVLLVAGAFLFVTIVYPRVKTINKQEVLGHATVSFHVLRDKAIAMVTDKAKKVGQDLKNRSVDLAQTKAMEAVMLQFTKLPPEEQDVFRTQICLPQPTPQPSETVVPSATPES